MTESGKFATYPKRNLAVGDYWFVNDYPRGQIRLRLTRLDRFAPPVEFMADGYPLGRGLPGDWDRSWYYRTAVSAQEGFPVAAGCWRVELTDGTPSDAIVFAARGIPGTFPRQ